jgi:hypothetical protein
MIMIVKCGDNSNNAVDGMRSDEEHDDDRARELRILSDFAR